MFPQKFRIDLPFHMLHINREGGYSVVSCALLHILLLGIKGKGGYSCILKEKLSISGVLLHIQGGTIGIKECTSA
jgi:hypothetical protein